MEILAFLILVILFFYFVSWEAILITIGYFVVLFVSWVILDEKKKLNGVNAILAFVIVTGITFGGYYGYCEYTLWRKVQEIQGKEVFLWMVKDRVHNPTPYSGSCSSGTASTVDAGNSSTSNTSGIYDDGYEAGYEDGIHRDHGAHKDREGYEYDDGYSQGYYDAVHEDEDWEDDEEEDW